MREEINRIVQRNKDRIVDLARSLVRINSENHPPKGNEGEVQEYIADFWADCGIEFDSFIPTEVPGFTSHPAYYDSGRTYDGRPVVVARIAGSGGGKNLILSGHVDTVPAVGKWTHGPYSCDIEDGKLYGRGAFDMKGGVASMMMAAALLRETGVRLKGDLLVETTCDEEFASSNGAVAARARGYTADAAVITEPTNLNVITAHRGFRLAQVTIAGRTGIPVVGGEMINPVQHLPPVLDAIERFRKARLKVTPEDAVMIMKLGANEFRDDELLTVPPECRIEIQWQTMAEEDHASVDADFESAIREACSEDPFFADNPAEITYRLRPMPGSMVSADAPIVREASAAVESVTGRPAKLLAIFPPCDAFVYNRFSGIPAIVFGPGGSGAHAPDEYVIVDDLHACVEVYMNLAVKWCGVE